MAMFYIVLLIFFGLLFLVAGAGPAAGRVDRRVLALVCYGSSVYLAFRDFGPVTGSVVIVVILILSLIATVVSLRAKTWQRFSLKQEIRSSSMPVTPAEELQVGDRGVTLSRLSPMGKVEIGGRTYEAKSQGVPMWTPAARCRGRGIREFQRYRKNNQIKQNYGFSGWNDRY